MVRLLNHKNVLAKSNVSQMPHGLCLAFNTKSGFGLNMENFGIIDVHGCLEIRGNTLLKQYNSERVVVKDGWRAKCNPMRISSSL